MRGEAQRYPGIGLAELKRKSFPFECPFCGEYKANNPRGRKALTCGDEICRAAYHVYWARDHREKRNQEQRERYARNRPQLSLFAEAP